MTTYQFRREDDGQIVEVGFIEMMEKDAAGCITLADGVVAREIRRSSRRVEHKGKASIVSPPIVSDALGVTCHQIAEFEADRVAHGFSGLEFRQDPMTPGFYQAHFSSWAEKDRYMKHRDNSLVDRSKKGSSVTMTPDLLRRAEELARREHGVNPGRAVPLTHVSTSGKMGESVTQCHNSHGGCNGDGYGPAGRDDRGNERAA